MQLLRFHYRKLFLFVVVLLMIALLVLSQLSPGSQHRATLLHKVAIDNTHRMAAKNIIRMDAPRLSHHTAHDRIQAIRLSKVFLNLTQEWRCPVCLGNDLCEDISSGFLSLVGDAFHPEVVGDVLSYTANIGVQHDVHVQVPDPRLYLRVETALCGEEDGGCGVKKAAARWPYIVSDETLSPAVLARFLAAVGGPPHKHPVLTCPTPLSLSVLEASFTSKPVAAGGGAASPTDKMNLLTALAVAPGYAVQKMAEQVQLSPSLVSLLGSCGRAWVWGREQLTSLTALLDEPWGVRAALGAQLLAVVEDMLEGSEEWLVFVSQWSVERLAVTGEGDLLLQDAAHATVIDKTTLLMGATGEYGEEDHMDTLGETCNRDCFHKRLSRLHRLLPPPATDRPQHTHETDPAIGRPHVRPRDKTIYSHRQERQADDTMCAHEDLFAHVMYASVCAFILSDEDSHRHLDYFPQLISTDRSSIRYKGVLHSPPSHLQLQLEQLVAGCVVERTPGDRLRTVEELKDLLAEYGGVQEKVEDEEDYEEEEEPEEDTANIQQRIKQFETDGGQPDQSRGL